MQQGANVIVTSDAIQTQGYDIPAFGEGTSYICVAQAAFAAVEHSA